LVLRFAIKISFLERKRAARLLPGGSKNRSEESSKGAPGGGMSSALILRRAPTLSPTCGRGDRALETGGPENSDPMVSGERQTG
jgi:hypothetical protein